MGNTCGSCAFDNRGSEFDMQPKDRLQAVTPTHNNPNIMKEENTNVVSNNVNQNQKETVGTKNRAAPATYDVETKENNFVGQYQVHEEKPVQQEVYQEKEALGN